MPLTQAQIIEIQESARYNHIRRVREEQEKRSHEEHVKELQEKVARGGSIDSVETQESPKEKTLSQMNKTELLAVATELDVVVEAGATNDDIRKAIRSVQ